MPSGSSGWRSPKCARAREQSRSARRAHEREPNALLGEENRILMMLAIVASELGSNIIKYGVRGSLEMEPIENAEGSGVSVVARDFGPPFHDLAMALEDGCDDRGPIDPMQMLKRRGIGGGLGAVIRLTHSFHVHSLVDGKEIRVARYKKRLADKHRSEERRVGKECRYRWP